MTTSGDANLLEKNARFWDGAAARWRAFGLPGDEEVQVLIGTLNCPRGALLADVGCGVGRWSVALARLGYRVRGVDVSPGMIAEARALAADHGLTAEAATFAIGDAEHLAFPDAAFDGIVCRNVLFLVPSPGAALVEFWRVLKPGGRLVLETPGAYSPIGRQAWRRFLPVGATSSIANHILPWEMEALLGELGWQIVAQRPYFGPAATGVPNGYTPEIAERLDDRVLQQTIATFWEFVAEKPGSLAS